MHSTLSGTFGTRESVAPLTRYFKLKLSLTQNRRSDAPVDSQALPGQRCDGASLPSKVVEMTAIPKTMRQLRSLVTADGELQLSIATVPTPVPGPGEVLVRMEAAPINPSDLALLIATADVSKAKRNGDIVTAPIPPATMGGLTARVGESMPVGNEGCGIVVAAGDDNACLVFDLKTVKL